VTHYGVAASDIERVLTASADALRETTARPVAVAAPTTTSSTSPER
jgi:hypothetical protein